MKLNGGVCALLAFISLALIQPVFAVEQCRDYAWYRVSGENLNGLSVASIRSKLKARGYKRFPFTNAARMPDRAMRSLKSGYVILMDNGGHAGFVNANGTIDHFIQLQGEVGVQRNPKSLPLHAPGNAGGLFQGDSLKQMFSRRFKKDPGEVEIWRPIK